MSIGWIKLHRQIQDCEIWDNDNPFDDRSAWIDLLLLVNHRDKSTIFDGKPITVCRGQRITSIRKLAERWNWSYKRTRNYLMLLEQLKMITRESDNKKSLITIVNYDIYQDEGITEESQRNHRGITGESQGNHRLPTNKNEKNDKNEKNKKSSAFVPPSIDEVRAYCQERNNKVDAQAFIDFYSSKGWMVGKNKMKDWKASVRTWETRNKETRTMGKGNFDSMNSLYAN